MNRNTATIDYRPRHRQFGLRVWKDRCQMIAPIGPEWTGVGPQLELPLEVPSSAEDIPASSDASNIVRMAAFCYELEQPGSDLFEVLKKEKPFEQAIDAA